MFSQFLRQYFNCLSLRKWTHNVFFSRDLAFRLICNGIQCCFHSSEILLKFKSIRAHYMKIVCIEIQRHLHSLSINIYKHRPTFTVRAIAQKIHSRKFCLPSQEYQALRLISGIWYIHTGVYLSKPRLKILTRVPKLLIFSFSLSSFYKLSRLIHSHH